MIDIETLGNKNNAVILSLGAVMFDDNKLNEEFLMNITSASNLKLGRVIDGDTLDWWLTQEPEAIKSLIKPRPKDLGIVLLKFQQWVKNNKPKEFWANGASFDLGILRNCYETNNMKVPWHFRDENCMRSIRTLGGEVGIPYKQFKEDNNKNVHSALEDAKCQAKYIQAVMKAVK